MPEVATGEFSVATHKLMAINSASGPNDLPVRPLVLVLGNALEPGLLIWIKKIVYCLFGSNLNSTEVEDKQTRSYLKGRAFRGYPAAYWLILLLDDIRKLSEKEVNRRTRTGSPL